ncbi:hypothetical protein [Micromonospora sp. NPDC005305]|uniref:hypothetical protein n=1 Tax=Micromonospora sp. NPDC005305 TaxID=3156875 RepID=UPI0033ABCC50
MSSRRADAVLVRLSTSPTTPRTVGSSRASPSSSRTASPACRICRPALATTMCSSAASSAAADSLSSAYWAVAMPSSSSRSETYDSSSARVRLPVRLPR